jgi:membrane-bound lytic murein transglycosylase B
MRRLAAAALAAALSLTACASDAPDKPKAARATTTSSSTSTSLAPTTTTTLPPPDFSATTSDDPGTAAAAITRAEAATLDPATPPDVVRKAALALQLAYRKIGHLELAREQAVSAALPDDAARQALANNVAATRFLIMLTGNSKPREAPPAEWQIVAPAPVDELLGYYNAAAATTGVPWNILAAVHLVETKIGRIRGVSSAGAQGPMQFMPATWKAYGQGDIMSNRDAIAAAARYLKANGAPERLDDALWRYNHSKHYVEAIKAYARRMAANERAFYAYHQWQVLYRTAGGVLLLPEGWPAIPAQLVA